MSPAFYLWVACLASAVALIALNEILGCRPTRWAYELALDLRNGFVAARRQREMIAEMRAKEAWLDAHKARIVGVGPIEVFRNDGRVVRVRLHEGWVFEADVPIPESRLGMDGRTRYMGWLPEELAEIHARRSEWTN